MPGSRNKCPRKKIKRTILASSLGDEGRRGRVRGKAILVVWHGNSRVKISRSFAFRLWMRRDITGCSAEYSAVSGRRREGGEGDWFSKDSGLIRFETCIVRPFVYIYVYVYKIYMYTQIYAMEWNRGRYQYARCATGRS